MSTTSDAISLTMTHTFNAERERVWAAWTNPMALTAWFKPGPEHSTVVHVWELKPGGRYRVSFNEAEGKAHTAYGVFREINAPGKLSFTWQWVGIDLPETLVTVDLKPNGERTDVTLTHTGFPAEQMRDHHSEGWSGIYQGLEGFLSADAAATARAPRMVDAIIGELKHEAVSTRRLLERVPGGKLDYRPHAKAMSLAQLARHVASIPGDISGFLTLTGPMTAPDFTPPAAENAEGLPEMLDASVNTAVQRLERFDDATFGAGLFRLNRADGTQVMAVPFPMLVRSILLNHWYHHRGQLCTYLRTLDVPLPSVFGPSADESPF